MKNHFKKLFASILLLAWIMPFVHAQTTNYSGVKKFQLQNLKPIIENNVVKGYYMYFYLDKASKKENRYKLSILDNELEEVHAIEMKKPKTYSLLESSFNGETFCFSYIDMKKKKIEYLILDKEGKETGKYVMDKVSQQELAYITSMTSSKANSYTGGLTSVDGKGFVRYGWEKDKGAHAILEMFDNKGKKIWEAKSPEKNKVAYENMVPFYSDGKVIVTLVTSMEKLLGGGRNTYLAWYDSDNGELLFTLNMKGESIGKEVKVKGKSKSGKNKNILIPISVTHDEQKNEYFVCGEYFKDGTNPFKAKSMGMYLMRVSGDGEVLQESFAEWGKTVASMLAAKDKEKFLSRNVTIHQVVRTSEGKIFAIGEQFKKTVNWWAVPFALSRNSNVAIMKAVLYDMVIFEFDDNLGLKEVHTFNKSKSNVILPKGIGINSATILGYYMKMMGWFDYEFSSMSEDGNTFSTAYVNYTRKKKEGRGYKVGTVTYTTSKVLSEDKIPLDKKATQFLAMPAKPGYVTIMEYYRKKKSVDLRMEKVNL